MQVRRDKLDRLRAAGVDPYPHGFPRTTTHAALRKRFAALAPDTATGEHVGVAGRVVLNRLGGKLCFATLRDGSGDLQVMFSLDRLGADALAHWKSDVDLGDHVGVEGEVITSRRGELSVLADRWVLTAKSLRPLPEKFRGLSDPEARVRQRYLDLVVNPDARRMLEVRSATVRSIRASLERRGFIEVETPMLQPVHGGATARPFVTHMNALNLPLYLRIAPELYLKRLLVGGVEQVFEINRSFRNEGIDASHNPEFTMLEAYQAYGDYDSMAALTRELIQEATVAAYGSTVVRHTDQQALEVELRSNAQVERQVEGVHVGDEGSGGRSTVHRLQHRGLHLDESPALQRRPNRPHGGAAHLEHPACVRVDDQVEVALPDAGLRVGQPAELLRQRPQRLGGEHPAVGQHAELTSPRCDHLSFDADVVAEVDVGLPVGERIRTQPVQAEHHLQVAAAVAQGGEAELAPEPVQHHSTRHTDVLAGHGVGGQCGEPLAQRRVRGRARKAARVRIDAGGPQSVELVSADLHLLRGVGGPEVRVAVGAGHGRSAYGVIRSPTLRASTLRS